LDRKFQAAIEAIEEREDPGFRERLKKQASEEAQIALGIRELVKRDEQIQSEQTRLEEESAELRRRIVAVVTNVPPSSLGTRNCSRWDWERVLDKRAAVERRRLMEASPLGKKILALKKEQDELVDTIFLATSAKEVKTLWQRVSELLSSTNTPLQEAALATNSTEA
jgi:hypothetical protein